MKIKVLIVLTVVFVVKFFFSCQQDNDYNCGIEQYGFTELNFYTDESIVKEDFLMKVF